MKHRIQKILKNSMLKTFVILQLVMLTIFVVVVIVFQSSRQQQLHSEISTTYSEVYNDEIKQYLNAINRQSDFSDSKVIQKTLQNIKSDAFSHIEVVVFQNNQKLNETFSYQDYRRDYFIKLLLVDKPQFSTYYNRVGNLRVIYAQKDDFDVFVFVDLNYILPRLLKFTGIISDEFGNVIISNFYGLDSLRIQDDINFNGYVVQKVQLDNYTYVHTIVQKHNDFQIYSLGIIILITLTFTTYLILRKYIDRLILSNTQSLDHLLNEVELIQNKHKQLIEIHSDDEFENLANSFNQLLTSIHELNIRNQQLAKLENFREIKQLEAQFQPHFLYNTLDAIKYSISIDPKQAIKLIQHLTIILRYSIDSKITKSYFEEDMEYIKSFLEINQIRLQDRFKYTLNIDQKYLKLPVPKLLIQPLIENSVKYAYQQKGNVEINISITEDENNYIINVKDNGTLSNEKVEALNNVLSDHLNDTNHHGVFITNRRIKLFYGKLSYLKIEYDNGVVAKVFINKQEVIAHV